MTWNCRSFAAVSLAVLLVGPPELALAQQSSLQTSFLSSSTVHIPNPLIPSIVEIEHLPYIRQIAKDRKLGASFSPTGSDLLIQQAEERFANGKKFYSQQEFDKARQEFDAAIDIMLRASENPTDRPLFESKLEDMVDAIHHDDLVGLGAAAQSDLTSFDKAPLDDILQLTFPVDPRLKDKVQSEVKNTSSTLPLMVNDAVLSYINYFAGRGHRTIEAGLARSGKYRPMISRVLAEEGVPQELIHLAQAEFGFLPRAVSRAAAEGMWQFVKFRGNQYGLMQTPYSDERLDPEKATRAAARHLHDLYNEFGDWYLAIAAYNCGPGAIEKAVEHTGYADFWELRARGALPKETTNYVPIILAMTIMAKNAPAYGLDQIVPDEALEYDTIRTTSPTNMALIGDIADMPLPQLLQLNPALLRSTAPGNFEIRVPKGTGEQLTSSLQAIPAERLASSRMHKVASGDSLASIARQFNASSSQIASANNLSMEAELNPGDQLLIPAAYREPATASRVPTRTSPRSSGTRVSVRKGSAVASRGVANRQVATAKPAPHRTAGTIAQLHHPQPMSR